MPDLHGPSEGQDRQDGGQKHGRNLSCDDDPMAVVPVGDDASHGSDQEDGQLCGEAD